MLDEKFIPAIISVFSALLVSLLTFKLKFRELEKASKVKIREEHWKQRISLKLKYLEPLRISVDDLYNHLIKISSELSDKERSQYLLRGFERIYHMDWDGSEGRSAFLYECNSGMYFPMSTMYLTAIYFFRAKRIRSEFPFIKLNPTEDFKLFEHLSNVRESFSGEFGIWETLQDSIGFYVMASNEDVIPYQEFCEIMTNKNNRVKFWRLVDFYRHIDKKNDNELPKILNSLKNFNLFLEKQLKDLDDEFS